MVNGGNVDLSFLIVKNKKHLLKTLKKIGDDIVIVKQEAVYAFPKGMYEQVKDNFAKAIKSYQYYRVDEFVKKIKVKK